MTEQWDYSSMDLMDRLEEAFPFARRIEVTVPLERDGSFLAELVLPVRHGESRVQLYRYPQGELYPAHERELRWRHPHKLSFGEGRRWGWYTAWDGVASREEMYELVSKRVQRHPLLSPAGGPG